MNRISTGLFVFLTFYSCGPKLAVTKDIVVIGGGLMGSATAWQLAKQDKSVWLLEMQDSVYNSGSSYGAARIARSNNRGNDMWSYLHNRSVVETQILIDYLDSTDAEHRFEMEDIYTTSPVTYVGRTRIYDQLFNSLVRQQVDYKIATNPNEGRQKFDVILPDSVLIQREFNVHSGTLDPGQLIAHLHNAVKKKGSRISYGTRVTDLNFNKDTELYEVTTVNGSGVGEVLKTPRIVCAAGPYTGSLLKNIAPVFEELINPQRVFLAFLQINHDKYRALSNDQQEKLAAYYPVINSSKGTRDQSFFSMIEYYDQHDHPVIKIGGHFQRSTINDLDEVWNQEVSADEMAWSINNTADYFKLLDLPISNDDIEYVDGYSCVYSLTESEVPFVTPISSESGDPNYNCIVLGGMSGVGAKGAMTYGLLAANLMIGNLPSDSSYIATSKALGFERLMNK